MRLSYKLLLVFSIASGILNAQPKPAKPIPSTVQKDTAALNFLKVINAVTAIANDPKQPAENLVDKFLNYSYGKGEIFSSKINVPGFENTQIDRYRTTWENNTGTTTWIWETRKFAPKNAMPQTLHLVKVKIDSILKKKYSQSEAGYNYGSGFISLKYNSSALERDELYLSINFDKPTAKSKEQFISEVLSDLKNELQKAAEAKSIGEAVKNFGERLDRNNIPRDEIFNAVVKELKEIANRNIRAAFEIIIQAPYFIESRKLTATLTYSQQEEIKKLAQEVVDNYNKPKPTITETKKPAPGPTEAERQASVEYKKFIAAFTKLSIPYNLTAKNIGSAKNITDLPFTKKYMKGFSGRMYAVGIISDCGNSKTLLAAQMSQALQSNYNFIFYIVKIRDEKITTFNSPHDSGVFYMTDDYLGSNCSLQITSPANVIITTNQNDKRLWFSANGACY